MKVNQVFFNKMNQKNYLKKYNKKIIKYIIIKNFFQIQIHKLWI
jgi:hypothetical protein